MGALDRTISRRTGRRGRVLRRRQPDDDHNATRFARVNRPRVARYFDQERAVSLTPEGDRALRGLLRRLVQRREYGRDDELSLGVPLRSMKSIARADDPDPWTTKRSTDNAHGK